VFLQADDIEVGTLMTVHSSKNGLIPPFAGMPLQVVMVALPYIVSEAVSGGGARLSIDIRIWNLMSVTPQYVEALMGMTQQKAG
jgi:hypothetical protein